MSSEVVRVQVACTECGHTVSLRREKYEASLGKRAQCPQCNAMFIVGQPDTALARRPNDPIAVQAVRAPAMPAAAVERLFACSSCSGHFAAGKIFALPNDAYICHACHGRMAVPAAPTQPLAAPAAAAPIVIHNNIVNAPVFNEPQKRWSRAAAGLFSFVIPGLGQLYKGRPIRGVAWFVMTSLGYVCFIIPGLALHACCVLGAMSGDAKR